MQNAGRLAIEFVDRLPQEVDLFAGFGLFAPRNAITVVVLFLGALSLSAAIFLINELNNPLEGFSTNLRAPLDTALAHLGQ